MAAPATSEVGLPDQKRPFDCSNSIEPLRCSCCKHFESHKLVDLTHHFRKDHSQSEENFSSSSPYFKHIYKDHDYCTFESVLGKKSILFKCQHCPYLTRLRNHLKRHILRKHTDPIQVQWFECDHCPYRSQNKSNLNEHYYFVHHYLWKYECDFCRFETTIPKRLTSHVLLKHTLSDVIQWYECEHCPFKTKRNGDLKHHVHNIHGKGESLKCDKTENAQSEENCNFQTFLQDHNYCSLEPVLDKKSRLVLTNIPRHQLPGAIQWFKCGHCAYRSKTERNLIKHYTIHRKKTKYKCPNCQFESKFEHMLKRHIFYKHTKLKAVQWFECEHCSYKSKLKGNINRHIYHSHGKKETLKCDYCAYQTTYKHALKRHNVAKHTDPKSCQWFYCEQCPYRSKLKAYLLSHRQLKGHRIGGDKK